MGAAFIFASQAFLIIVFSENNRFDFAATTVLTIISLILAGVLRKDKLEEPH